MDLKIVVPVVVAIIALGYIVYVLLKCRQASKRADKSAKPKGNAPGGRDSTGVREPRRPTPSSPSVAKAAKPPEADTNTLRRIA